eukprot:s95_g18.t1
MYVERARSRDDPPSTPGAPSMSRGSSHHASQLPLPPSSSTSSDGPASRDVVIVADFSELHYLADENWNFSAMHPLNHIPLSLMEEKALWQYTRYVYSNQVDTYMFDQLLSGIAERIEEQWQISISPDDLDLRFALRWYRVEGTGRSTRPDASGSTSTSPAPDLVLPSWSSSTTTTPAPPTTPLAPMITSQTYGATPPSASGGPIPSPFVPDTTDGAPYHTFNQYSQERRHPKHQLMFTVVEWNHGTPTASRDLMVTETNLETGRPREHQVEFSFFKLVGDWNMAQRMGNYWRQHYGLDTYPVDTPPTPPSTPTLPTDALDTPIAVAVQLIREMRNLPLAASIDEYNNQLLALVGGSGISPRLSSVQLETLAVQFHQLSQVTSVLEQQASNLNPSSPGAADDSPDDHPLEDMEDDPRL